MGDKVTANQEPCAAQAAVETEAGADVCSVCGLRLVVGDFPCISRPRPHAPILRVPIFTPYFDVALGKQIDSFADRWTAMRGEKTCDGEVIRERVEYRPKMSKGDLSARQDRLEMQRRARARD